MEPQRFQLRRHRSWLSLVSSCLVAIFGLTSVWTPPDVFGMPGWSIWVRAAVLGPLIAAMAGNAATALFMLRSDPTILILTGDALVYRFGWRRGSVAWADIERIDGTRAAARVHTAPDRRGIRLDLGLCEPELSVEDLRHWAAKASPAI